MEVFDDIPSARAFVSRQKAGGKRVVLVPTMGALHDGHRACIDAGRAVEDASLVASVFVNPTQFGPNEDFSKYPRRLATDLDLCREWGVDAVFAPDAETMYPAREQQRVWVVVEGLTEPLCGRTRPSHFRGVTTVVAKLFHILEPDVAVFGQKDAQQALVIREMVRQLDMPVELRLAAIAREEDGLARSSRNSYIADGERSKAASIYRGLRRALDRARDGERDPAILTAEAERVMREGGIDDIEYVDLRDASDLSSVDTVRGKVILAVGARVGATRLIDNVVFRVGDDGSVAEEILF